MSAAAQEAFVRRGWRCFEHSDGSAFLTDAAAEYVGFVGSDAAAKRQALASQSLTDLRVASAHVRTHDGVPGEQTPGPPPASHRHRIQLAILGGRILATFTHQQCRDQVATYFSCSHDDGETTPDVIVQCEWSNAERHLFRARTADQEGVPLPGVRVWPLGSASPSAWTSAQPPIPPLGVPPFKDRFVALHGATVGDTDGNGVTILGDRGSGKSSSALHLCGPRAMSFLCDETTFVHVRTALVEPFPQSVGVWRACGRKEPVAAKNLFTNISTRPVLIKRLVFLAPQSGKRPAVEELSVAGVFRALLPHHRDASASLDEALVTLDHIARVTVGVRLYYTRQSELHALLDEVMPAGDVR